MWNLQFTSYQDVKNVLHRYTYLVSIILSLIAYFLVIPQQHQLTLNTVFGSITEVIPVGIVITLIFGFVISFLFVHLFEVYDKVYDRFVIKWRYKYAKGYILPELIRPFKEKVDKDFLETASKNMREFMNIFYSFVGDHDVKIRKTAVVRFYDAVWKYWATQINEVLFILFAMMLIGYSIYYYMTRDLQVASMITPSIIIVVLGIINRVISIYFLKYVRVMTKEEIEEIHENFNDELEEKVKRISRRFGLSYGNN